MGGASLSPLQALLTPDCAVLRDQLPRGPLILRAEDKVQAVEGHRRGEMNTQTRLSLDFFWELAMWVSWEPLKTPRQQQKPLLLVRSIKVR